MNNTGFSIILSNKIQAKFKLFFPQFKPFSCHGLSLNFLTSQQKITFFSQKIFKQNFFSPEIICTDWARKYFSNDRPHAYTTIWFTEIQVFLKFFKPGAQIQVFLPFYTNRNNFPLNSSFSRFSSCVENPDNRIR